MTACDLLPLLDGVRVRGSGKWSARCPAHADKSPSLSITEGDRAILIKCFAGCSLEEITGALGLRVSDLFLEGRPSGMARPPIKPSRLDRRALAFRFELYALDLRLRGERVLAALRCFANAPLTDTSQERLMKVAASAYADLERAEVFEDLADTLQWRAFEERTVRNAA